MNGSMRSPQQGTPASGPGDGRRSNAETRPLGEDAEGRHWRRSLRLIGALLVVWFAASFGCGILFRESLDGTYLPGTGFPLGFWFAQQGAILVFVALIAVYVALAGRIDEQLERERDEEVLNEEAER